MSLATRFATLKNQSVAVCSVSPNSGEKPPIEMLPPSLIPFFHPCFFRTSCSRYTLNDCFYRHCTANDDKNKDRKTQNHISSYY